MQDDMAPAPRPKGEGGRKGGGKGGGKAGGKAGGEGRKPGSEGPKNVEIQIARMMVRAQWQQEWAAANPDGANPERKAAWQEARQARMELHLKSVRKVLTSLQRQGVTMTLSETAAADADVEDDDAET